MNGGPSTTRKAVVDQKYLRNSENICKSIVGIDASQFYPSQCVKKCPLGITLDGSLIQTLRSIKLGNINRGNMRTWLYLAYNLSVLKSLLKVTTQLELRKRLIVLMQTDFVLTLKLYLKQWVVTFTFVHFRKFERSSISEEETQRGLKKQEYDELRRDYLQNKGYKFVEIWECNWWETLKGDESVKTHVRNDFPFKLPLAQESLLAIKREYKLFGYDQYDIEVPGALKYKFSNSPPSFKNFNVSRADIVDYMMDYAIDNDLLKQPQLMLISSFKLENGTIITPLLNFYLNLGLKCTKPIASFSTHPKIASTILSTP